VQRPTAHRRRSSSNRWLGMMFASRFVLPLLHGEKTETRRKRTLARPGDLLWVRETWGLRGSRCVYLADCLAGLDTPPARWRPAIHMPLEHARCWLRVKAARTEQLDELDDAGARRDGFTSKLEFLAYWESSGGPSSYRVLEFEVIDAPRRMVQLELPWDARREVG
jgi:hypothetical protein